MAETLLSYLTTRNPTVLAFVRPAPSFTFNDEWDPIDGIREWTDFNYNTLQLLFRDELSRHVSPFDTTGSCEIGGYNKIFDERGLSDLICMSIMGPISAVLPSDSFITSGGRVTQHPGCVPDWGAGKDGVGRSKAIVLGDTKFNWTSTNTFNVIQSVGNRPYEDSPSIDLRPGARGNTASFATIPRSNITQTSTHSPTTLTSTGNIVFHDFEAIDGHIY
ncbi:hypothetical protein N7516_001504 [Penicillium verrucosum]|uniref:uncharacterized protein n=1 Tax=Penicillium verrucosum TaxID=60171 RepID=UPI0025458E7C|nr:uncharacterized protein N7516_001504 [Penicillium verrucosum]KAJ5941336.1 hypothetical protein N7516_001504 [Penicillium verrucosum]